MSDKKKINSKVCCGINPTTVFAVKKTPVLPLYNLFFVDCRSDRVLITVVIVEAALPNILMLYVMTVSKAQENRNNTVY